MASMSFGDLFNAAREFEKSQGDESMELPQGSYPFEITSAKGRVNERNIIVNFKARVFEGEYRDAGASGVLFVTLDPSESEKLHRQLKSVASLGVDPQNLPSDLEEAAAAIAVGVVGARFSGKLGDVSDYDSQSGVVNSIRFVNPLRGHKNAGDSAPRPAAAPVDEAPF